MAQQAILISYSILDADGDRASMPIYGQYDDGSATLSSIAAWAAARAGDIDAICDGQIVSEAITLYPALPGGLKSAPNADSDVERTALFTFGLSSLAVAKSHGIDLPAFLPSKYLGDLVNTADTDVAAFVSGLLPSYGTIIPTSEEFLVGLATLRKARKSFRKLGR